MTDSPTDVRLGSEADLPFDYYTCKASQAFDQWFGCLTVGKQMSSYYRYGEKAGCGKHWKKLQLCMAVKVRSEESGKALMREYREAEAHKRNSLPNVLDVWTKRDRSQDNAGFNNSGTEPQDGSF